MQEAAHAAPAPSTTEDMGARHHSAVLAVAALGVAHAGPVACRWSAALCRALGVRDRLADPAAVALTFDDGPHLRGTPATLEVLRAAGIRATFFLVGEQVERHPQIAAEIAAAGHDVGVHCHRHRNLLRLAPAQVGEDLRRAEAAIATATGVAPRLYRPPYGILTTAALLHARRHAFVPLLWTRWGRDWRSRATPATIEVDAAAGLCGGEVILLHDADDHSAPGSWERTVAALPLILERIGDAGLEVRAA
jgi:peptidoglycan/xylan/chitin deacetylase (PgdA/CDA1 family)